MVALEKVTGGACIAAGTAWVAACLVHNMQPQGCVGDGCAGGPPMRAASLVGTLLLLLAGALLAVGLGGLVLLSRRRLGRSRVALAAGLSCAVALLLLAAAGVMSGLVDPDWDGMPWLVGSGVVLLAAGTVLVAVTLLRARVVPNALFAVLLASVLVLPFANEQTSLVLLAVPFGVALAVVGAHLVRRLPNDAEPVGARAAELA